MKKIVLCLVFLLCLCGCQKEKTIVCDQPSLYMELNNGTTNYPILEVDIHNDCDEEIYSANEHVYILEKYNGKEWQKIERKNNAHKDDQHIFQEKTSKKVDFYLQDDYGELKEGEYRITKEFFNQKDEIIKVEKEFFIRPPLSIDFESSVHEDSYFAYEKLQSLFKEDSHGEKVYPDSYGGAYTNEEGKLVVYLKDITKESDYRSQLRMNVIYKECQYSYNELKNIKKKISDFINQNPQHQLSSNICGLGICDDLNKVKVDVKKLSSEFFNEFKKMINSSNAVIFEEGKQPEKLVKGNENKEL